MLVRRRTNRAGRLRAEWLRVWRSRRASKLLRQSLPPLSRSGLEVASKRAKRPRGELESSSKCFQSGLEEAWKRAKRPQSRLEVALKRAKWLHRELEAASKWPRSGLEASEVAPKRVSSSLLEAPVALKRVYSSFLERSGRSWSLRKLPGTSAT